MNGGMQRCFHVIHQLAKYFELTAIIHQDKESFLKAVKEYPAIANIKVYSTTDSPLIKDIFSLLPIKLGNGLRYRWIKKEFKNSADGSFLRYYLLLRELLKQHTYDAIILENLNTINAVSVIRKYDKRVPIIYDAHNVDSNLSTGTVHQQGIVKIESTLFKKVNAIFTCSEKDRKEFIKMNRNQLPVTVIPNGVSIENQLYNKGVNETSPQYIIFCGALWTSANQEGLLWFYEKIWQEIKMTLPQLKLLVVGGGQTPDIFQPLLRDPSLVFTGAVEDVKPWYNKAAVAIVPLLSGSGTRLKILEAMSFGLPVISTSKGAEGIEYKNGNDIIIEDKEKDFSRSLINLINDKRKRILISETARRMINKRYDWDLIGNKIVHFINFEFIHSND
jgi:glycosyltransferase involved in cell wall biosynthesis